MMLSLFRQAPGWCKTFRTPVGLLQDGVTADKLEYLLDDVMHLVLYLVEHPLVVFSQRQNIGVLRYTK